ncbi:MAG: hypothetical protein IJ193_05245 [Bacilli bacterium]|nr:hypothetical protein [Bacilli bacterium]
MTTVKYQTTKGNYLKIFNDSLGISIFRDKILRNRKVKYMGFLSITSLQVILSLLFLFMMLILATNYYTFLSFFLFCLSLTCFIYVIINAMIPLLCAFFFTRSDEGELTIDENGITFGLDTDLGLKVGWAHIRGVVVGKHSVNIILDYNYFFYFDKKYKSEIVKAIREYNESLIILK